MVVKTIASFLFRKHGKMHDDLAALVARLSLDEAILAHNELTYGGFAGSLPAALHRGDRIHGDPKRAYSSVEVATSLYEYVQRLNGVPITLKQKAAYRIGLTKAVISILRDRAHSTAERCGNAMHWLSPYLLEQSDVQISDRSNMDSTILEMKRAVR